MPPDPEPIHMGLAIGSDGVKYLRIVCTEIDGNQKKKFNLWLSRDQAKAIYPHLSHFAMTGTLKDNSLDTNKTYLDHILEGDADD